MPFGFAGEDRKPQLPGFRTAISGHRYYNPSLGRFLGRDGIEEKGGLHLFAYCGNNAINLYDILGNDDFAKTVTDVTGHSSPFHEDGGNQSVQSSIQVRDTGIGAFAGPSASVSQDQIDSAVSQLTDLGMSASDAAALVSSYISNPGAVVSALNNASSAHGTGSSLNIFSGGIGSYSAGAITGDFNSPNPYANSNAPSTVQNIVAATIGAVGTFFAGGDPQMQAGAAVLVQNFYDSQGVTPNATSNRVVAGGAALGDTGAMFSVVAGTGLALTSQNPSLTTTGDLMEPWNVSLDRSQYPVSAQNIENGNQMGVPYYYNPNGAAANRASNLNGLPTSSNYDLDETPPAVLQGANYNGPVLITPTPISDNRGSGASLGNQLQGATPGQRVVITIYGAK